MKEKKTLRFATDYDLCLTIDPVLSVCIRLKAQVINYLTIRMMTMITMCLV
jgi:hypothetical protein